MESWRHDPSHPPSLGCVVLPCQHLQILSLAPFTAIPQRIQVYARLDTNLKGATVTFGSCKASYTVVSPVIQGIINACGPDSWHPQRSHEISVWSAMNPWIVPLQRMADAQPARLPRSSAECRMLPLCCAVSRQPPSTPRRIAWREASWSNRTLVVPLPKDCHAEYIIANHDNGNDWNNWKHILLQFDNI